MKMLILYLVWLGSIFFFAFLEMQSKELTRTLERSDSALLLNAIILVALATVISLVVAKLFGFDEKEII
ncbi:MAG: hypothetical protein II453_07000 [Alphaproteobacteria bacterium]|nr:hypothetical protein [Alphaproteobacteria bacterium]